MSPARKKKVKISGEKLPAACTISEDPRDVIRHIQKTKTAVNVTPAHQPPHGPGPTPRPEDMSNASIQLLQNKGTSKVKTTDEVQLQKLRHFRRMDSSLAIKALNSDDYYALHPNTGAKIRGNKQFTSSTPIESIQMFEKYNSSFWYLTKHFLHVPGIKSTAS